MYGVFRTDRSNKYEGISFLTLDMKSPGVEVRPIRQANGRAEFGELFDRAGFRLTNIVPTKSPFSVIEAIRRERQDTLPVERADEER